jgi:hypothetical protein
MNWLGREGWRASICAPNVSNVTLTRRVSYTRWRLLQRKVQCVLWLAKFESVTQVRREYRRVFDDELPHENSIRRWDRQLKETGKTGFWNYLIHV